MSQAEVAKKSAVPLLLAEDILLDEREDLLFFDESAPLNNCIVPIRRARDDPLSNQGLLVAG
jgi:hypothetical protein